MNNKHCKHKKCSIPWPNFPNNHTKREVDLRGKKVIVTGASRGNGRIIAEYLAREGAKVIGTSRKPSDFNNPERFIPPTLPKGVKMMKLDINNSYSVKEFVKDSMEYMNGELDILVASAVRMTFGSFLDYDPVKASEGNLLAGVNQVYVWNQLLPYMDKKGYARILSLSTAASLQRTFNVWGAFPYLSGKASLFTLTDGLREELHMKNYGVKVINFAPSITKSDLATNHTNKSIGPIRATPHGQDKKLDKVQNYWIDIKKYVGIDEGKIGNAAVQVLSMEEPPLTVRVSNRKSDALIFGPLFCEIPNIGKTAQHINTEEDMIHYRRYLKDISDSIIEGESRKCHR